MYGNGDAIPAGLTDGEWTRPSGATAVYGRVANYSPDIDACDEQSWRSMAACTIGMRWTMRGPVSERMACPNRWRVDGLENYIERSKASAERRERLEVDVRLEYGGNGTDDFGFSALPGGYRDDTWLLLLCREQRLLVEFFAQWRRCLVPELVRQHPDIYRTTTIHGSASRSGVLGMPIERSEGGLTL